ncbi:MAG: flippase-like domain-containing protein [Spirochaetales bacterium]|nr:flippase-like domain-containing protein [Spirochaetales bacterium]
MSKKLSKSIKGLILFLILSSLSIAAVLYFTVDSQTFDALTGIRPIYIIFCLVFWFIGIAADAAGLLFLVKGSDEKIRIIDSFKLSFARLFFNLITPFTFGGQPVVIYILKKIGVPSGKGSSIVVTRLLALTFFSVLGAIFSLLFLGNRITSQPTLQLTLILSGIMVTALYAVALIGLLYPPFMKQIFKLLHSFFIKFRIGKKPDQFLESAFQEIHHARTSFQNYFKKHLSSFSGGIICAGILHLMQVFILMSVIQGLGINIEFVEAFSLCSILFFLISFMPTPGSSGLGEGLFIILFAGKIPSYLIGITIILWRIFFQYLTALIGAVISARFFSNLIMNDKTPSLNETGENKTIENSTEL